MMTPTSFTTLGWKVALIALGTIGLLSGLIKKPGFWSSYLLDMVGPAWIYILLRVLYTSGSSSFLSLKLTPIAAFLSIFGICATIETSQYFKIYDAHFDPYDYIAYTSLLLPIYLLDKYLLKFQNDQ